MLAREIGFHNINIDLISSLPGQSVKDWEATLERVIDFSPEHISAYSLIIEEGTPFYEKYGQDADFSKELPDEETDRFIYKRTKEVLEKHGYLRYEISNYAKPGYECKHNSSYWTRDEYLGLGLGAASLIKETRFHNTSDLTKYLKECLAYQENSNNWSCNNKQVKRVDTLLKDFIGIREEIEKLNLKQQMEEFMFLGLRMCKGIRLQIFEQKFHQNIDDIYGNEIKKLEEQKLIVKGQDNISLTEHGIDVSNYVFLQFIKD
jgi:oxygen-independent coproporphyrinogen-3 oxidase